jgi:DNA-binding winged helix-turn-helix (wHTH) protein/TolB-like protein/tetratricopeptide (TPR) repeat protein
MAEVADLLDGFQIGPHKVYPRREQISVDGEMRHVEPKVMQVLVTLAEHAQNTVSREDLLNRVWADAVVGDEVISRAVSLLRTLLGDDRTKPRFIRTVPRLGYELIVEATPLAGKPGKPLVRISAAVAACAVILICAVWWINVANEPASIAVLPFRVADNPDQLGALRQAIADDILALIDDARGISGVAKRSSFALIEPNSNIQSMGESLGASFIVDGDLASNPQGEVRATVYLVDVDTGTNLWTIQLSKRSASALQQAVVGGIQEALATHTGATFPRSKRSVAPLDQNAYRAYLEAKYHWSVRGEQRMSRSIELLRKAIELEPEFSAAHLALAQALALEPFYNDKDLTTQFALARAALANAIALNSTLSSDALALEGFMLMRERRWDQAISALEQSLKEKPDSPLGNYWYATILAQIGHYDRSVRFAERAFELDPTSAVLGDRVAVSNMWAGNLARAEEQYDLAFRLGHIETVQRKSYAMFLYRRGRYKEMVELLTRAGLPAAWGAAFESALTDAALRPAAVAATRQAIEDDHIPTQYRFGIWLLLGEASAAFDSFDMSLKNPDAEILWASEAQILRDHDRFAPLLEQLNLSAYLRD